MMRIGLSLLLVGLVSSPIAARAQTTVALHLGATRGTKLLGDRVNPFDELYGVNVTQAVEPTGSVSLAGHLYKKYRYRVEAQFGSTTLTVRNQDTDESYTYGTLRTLAIIGFAEGEIVRHLEWQVGVGAMIYLPQEKSGFFKDGGPKRALLAVGLTRRVPLTQTLSVAASVRYDFHQFTTQTLADHGFSQSQTIHRVGLSLGLEHAF